VREVSDGFKFGLFGSHCAVDEDRADQGSETADDEQKEHEDADHIHGCNVSRESGVSLLARAVYFGSAGGRPPGGNPGAVDQTRTPYFDVLLDYVDTGVIPFHTPGHKQGHGMERAFREFVGDNVLSIDLTQIRGLDDLLQPTGPIDEAQRLAAEAYGSDYSFFLINGSTSGNQIMMMTAVNPGEKIALPRNAHKSAMGALIMSGAHPVYMQPEVDEALHMDHTVTPETVRKTLAEHPDVKAVYVVSPTYYGVAADRTFTSTRCCPKTRSSRAPTCASTRRTR
jgi:hypothetical protein